MEKVKEKSELLAKEYATNLPSCFYNRQEVIIAKHSFLDGFQKAISLVEKVIEETVQKKKQEII
jgi:hypothetical protein